MLGLVLLYFVGREFYRLAEQFGKSKWLFAILGIMSYYAGLFLGGIIVALIFAIISPDAFYEETYNELLLSLLALPIGLLSCWIFYRVLKKIWEGVELKTSNTDILDDDLFEPS